MKPFTVYLAYEGATGFCLIALCHGCLATMFCRDITDLNFVANTHVCSRQLITRGVIWDTSKPFRPDLETLSKPKKK